MLTIKSSQIKGSGKGLFTNKSFLKGNKIIKFVGKILTDKQVIKLSDKQKEYLIEIGKNKTLYVEGCKASFTNDANFGNNKFKNNAEIVIEDNGDVYLYATKNIKSGEEIFTDYGKEYWKSFNESRIKLFEEFKND